MLSSRSRITALCVSTFCLSTFFMPMSAMSATAQKTTSDSPNNPAYMWDLTDLYKTPADWDRARSEIQTEANKLDQYKGTLGKSAGDMLAALNAFSHARKEWARLSTYAGLKGDENVKIAANQERVQAAQSLGTLISAKTAWLAPEVLSLGAEKVKGFVKQSPELAKHFGFFLDNILRGRPHTLGAEAEGVLAEAGTPLNQPNAIYSQLANGELPFPTITLSDGEKVRLDQAAYSKYRMAPNRNDRKKVFDSYWKTFADYQGTMGATLTAQVLGEVFEAKVRHFPNALAAATFGDNMPEAVYRTLVDEANKNLPVLHRYLKLRQKALGISDELQYYDAYAPIFSLPVQPKFSVADSERITLDVTKPYGPEYTALLKKGFSGRWMNLFPAEGKANGAYMNGSAYDVHPYLLFNNHDDFESLSTFAHEWGHAVHTLLTTKNQPFETADYSTFIAETASIGNEMLLNDYMVAHAKDKAEKLYYLGQGLELIRTTFFRQTMFAEFQLALHEEVEKGGTLSGERMSQIYCGMLKKYYGEAEGVMKIDPAYCVEWAFIPHFYYGFYVYQYATSMAGAALLTDSIEHEGKPAAERFITMLKAGGSEYPYELYKKAGLDMATPAPYEALAARMTRIMDQIEALQKS